MIAESLYRLTYRALLRFASRRDHMGAACGHILYGLHNRLLRYCSPDTVIRLQVHGVEFEFPAGHLFPVYAAQNPRQELPWLELVEAVARHRQARPLVVVDVGANIGDTAILAARSVSDARFVCIEGDSWYFQLLERNVTRQGIASAFLLHQCFLGEPADLGQAMTSERAFGTGRAVGSAVADGHPKDGSVKILDQILRDANLLERVTVLKVDTDGFDYRVLRGARECILKNPVLFFELSPPQLIDQGESPMSIFAYLRNLGYSSYILYTNFGELLWSGRLSDEEEIYKLVTYNLHYRRFHYDMAVFGDGDAALFSELSSGMSPRHVEN